MNAQIASSVSLGFTALLQASRCEQAHGYTQRKVLLTARDKNADGFHVRFAERDIIWRAAFVQRRITRTRAMVDSKTKTRIQMDFFVLLAARQVRGYL